MSRATGATIIARPVLMAVDDEPAALGAIEGELRKRYGDHYQVECVATPEAGLGRLEQLKGDGGQLALVLADQWMPSMTGIEFLRHARRLHPRAQRVVLINWGDRSTAESILQASALGQIDDWTAKPWGPGDELFHHAISGYLSEWGRLHRPRFEVFQVVGEQWAPRSHEIRDLLSRNSIPFGFYPVDSSEGQGLLERAGGSSEQLPVVVLFDGRVLVDPSNAELAAALGIKTRPEATTYDLTVIGAGPAGLAAAMYGASEGLATAVLEHEALGGQAGTSSMIRNYLGFPRGVSGTELAQRAYEQAWILGADFIYGPSAIGLRTAGPDRVTTLGDGAEATSRAVVLGIGVTWRRLGVPSLEALVGAGVFYGAAASEAPAMKGQEVYVVGGANSAGQAAVHLAKYAARVIMLVRGSSLAEAMSNYLVREIEAAPNIAVRYQTEAINGHGDGHLTALTLKDRTTGTTETVPATALFILIGAVPHTDWLPETIRRDRWGFVLTGADLLEDGWWPAGWPLERPPMPLETSLPGIFAVGDVRHGSVKRVASAVGEGSIAVRQVHDYLGHRSA